jgi:hypothetical protein
MGIVVFSSTGVFTRGSSPSIVNVGTSFPEIYANVTDNSLNDPLGSDFVGLSTGSQTYNAFYTARSGVSGQINLESQRKTVSGAVVRLNASVSTLKPFFNLDFADINYTNISQVNGGECMYGHVSLHFFFTTTQLGQTTPSSLNFNLGECTKSMSPTGAVPSLGLRSFCSLNSSAGISGGNGTESFRVIFNTQLKTYNRHCYLANNTTPLSSGTSGGNNNGKRSILGRTTF